MALAKSYQPFLDSLASSDLEHWSDGVANQLERVFAAANNGHLPRWLKSLAKLPMEDPSRVDLGSDAVTVGEVADLSNDKRAHLRSSLADLCPWRKGPFDLFGVEVDAEWQSNLKWDRLKDSIAPLGGRTVLDVGSGNGYYGWRMCAAGAKQVVGVDPYLLYIMQFLAMRRYVPLHFANWVLPFGIDDLPAPQPTFDTVFSMGILYHRKSPLDHLGNLFERLLPGGELVLETLVVDGPEGYSLLPRNRYAKMRNVWFLPSQLTLESWLRRCGYSDVQLVDVAMTSIEEQRRTDWMRFESLQDYLDPDDPWKTVEGYPGPTRAIYLARK